MHSSQTVHHDSWRQTLPLRESVFPVSCRVVGGTAVFQGHASVYEGPVIVHLEVCDHEALLMMSSVMQATGWRIVHICLVHPVVKLQLARIFLLGRQEGGMFAYARVLCRISCRRRHGRIPRAC